MTMTTTRMLIVNTPLPTPTSILHEGGGGEGPTKGSDDGGIIAGAVVAVLIITILVILGLLIGILVPVKRRSKSRLNHEGRSTLWYIKASPGVRRSKVSSDLSELEATQKESSKSMTPDFLVVRHKKGKSTVPNAGLFYYSGNILSTQPAPTQRWSERSSMCPDPTLTAHGDTTPTMSTGDVTLPRHIRSSSVDTNSTHRFEGSSTAASSLSRPGKSLKVYQMPSFEDDNIILTNDAKNEDVEEEKRSEENEKKMFRNTSKTL